MHDCRERSMCRSLFQHVAPTCTFDHHLSSYGIKSLTSSEQCIEWDMQIYADMHMNTHIVQIIHTCLPTKTYGNTQPLHNTGVVKRQDRTGCGEHVHLSLTPFDSSCLHFACTKLQELCRLPANSVVVEAKCADSNRFVEWQDIWILYSYF